MGRSFLAGTILSASAALLLASPALAQQAQSRDDDVEFAIGLADRGYFELAQAEVDRMLAGSPTAERRRTGEYIRCELLRRALRAAMNDPKQSVEDVRKKFPETRKGFEEYIAAGGPKAADAEFALAQLFQDLANFLGGERTSELPVAEQAAYRKEAEGLYDQAIRLLASVRKREEGKADRVDVRNKAWYFSAVATHEKALLYPVGDPLRLSQLTEAEKEIFDFFEEAEGTLPGYYAAMYLAKTYWKRAQGTSGWKEEDLRQANEYFHIAIGAVDAYAEPRDAATLESILTSALLYGRMCNEVRKQGDVSFPSIFVRKMEELEGKLPATRTQKFGLAALVEKARALSSLGQHQAAIDELAKVSDAASAADPRWGRSVDLLAKRALNDILAALPPDAPVALSPEILMKAGQGCMAERKWGLAIRAFQRAILACEGAPTPELRRALLRQNAAKAWIQINTCYGYLERYQEAFLAADFPVQQYLAEGRRDEDQEIASCANFRILAKQALMQQAVREKDPARAKGMEKDVTDARRLYVERFPWSEASGDQVYLDAVQALNNGDCEAAIGKFKAVKTDSLNYNTAQVRIAEAYLKWGKPDEALAHLAAQEKRLRPLFEDASVPAGKKQPYAIAVFWTAVAHDERKAYEKVIETLAEFERRFSGAQVENFFPRVRYLRGLAFLQGGKRDDANRIALQLIAESPDSTWTPILCLAVADSFRLESVKEKGIGNKTGALDLIRHADPLYEFWLSRLPNPGPENLRFLGGVKRALGKLPAATDLYQRARDRYREQNKAEDVEALTVDLAQVLTDQQRYAEALHDFQALLARPQPDLKDLKECFAALVLVPQGAPPDYEKRLKEQMGRILDRAAKDPDAAGCEDPGRKALALSTIAQQGENLVRAFDRTPESRRALAGATAITVLEENAQMHRLLRPTVLGLVKRTPELLEGLGRCYDALSVSRLEYCIGAVNLYQALVDGAQTSPNLPPEPRTRYSADWFEWKLRIPAVYLRAGTAKGVAEWLTMVCDIVRSMEVLEEIKRAEEVRPGLGKAFQDLRAEADAALRKIGKGGCR